MTLNVITAGGGQYIVNVLNAVAAWCGGGGFRSMLQVMMVMGLAYCLIIMALSLNWRVLFNWFITASLMYMCMIVPTTTIVVQDRINPTVGNGSVANVPIGLGLIASFSSQINDWLTQTAQSVFTMPSALQYTSGGMIYPTRLNDLTQQFVITDPIMKANTENYLQQCTFYDILLGQGNGWGTLAGSSDLLSAIGPGSAARSTPWIPAAGGTSSIIGCQTAYQNLVQQYPAMATAAFKSTAPAFYPTLSQSAAINQLQTDLPVMAQTFYGTSATPQLVFQQRSLVNAFLEARANFGAGGGDTFAALHADIQAQNSYISAARQAMTWVPVLNLVLTIVFYAMFPVIFPLFLFPTTGVATMKGYLAGFFYLASWGPLYAVLHMFITQYSATQLNALSPGGMTMSTMGGIDAIDQNMQMLAGYLLMFVPVLAGGMAKGATSIAQSTGQMLGPAMQAAEAAAAERTTGNYSYGNEHAQNRTSNQVNTAPTMNLAESSTPQVNMRRADGTVATTMADGSMVYDSRGATSHLPFTAAEVRGVSSNLQQTGAEFHARANQIRESSSERWSQGMRQLESMSSGSRSAAGSEGAFGAQGANSRTHAFRTGDEVRDTTGTSRTITSTASEGKTAGTSGIWSAGAKGILGIGGDLGTPGKGILGSGVKGRGDLTGSVGYQHQIAHGENVAETNSDAQSASDSRNAAHYRANGEDVTLTDGGYWRNGNFHRVENFAEKRHAIEKDFSTAQSLERQASQSDDTGTRLERIASVSQSNGWQLSDDMSQVIASRYDQMARSPEFRDLGAPALTKTDVSAHQREVRSMIVSRVLQDYAANDLSAVQAQIKDPVSERGAVHGPGTIHVPTHVPSMPTGMPPVGGESGAVPGQQAAQDSVGAGKRSIATQAAQVKGAFSNRSAAADRDDAEIKGRVQ